MQRFESVGDCLYCCSVRDERGRFVLQDLLILAYYEVSTPKEGGYCTGTVVVFRKVVKVRFVLWETEHGNELKAAFSLSTN
jgi:hypothetical protein